MKCPQCQFDNRKGVNFCEECGANFELECPACNANIHFGSKFCGECGYNLIAAIELSQEKSEPERLPSRHFEKRNFGDATPIAGERKYVTALFSDLSGYTAMSERLDPEEVKEILSKIFYDITKIIGKYEGFIEKFAGDAVMAMFGAEITHEDDPVRAIRAAREIHNLVKSLSPQYEIRIKHPLSMHTGINTGLVVTGAINVKMGTHGASGEPLNLASRLSALAKPDEIIVGPITYRRTEGYFSFKCLEPASIKGKNVPVQIYKVMDQKERPITIHRLSGVRADLIGRKAEFAEIEDAVTDLRKGKGRIFSICGDAGMGKSRFVEEVKATLDLEKTQWIEAHAYAYAQNIPYFPLVDLLNRIFHIEEGDAPDAIRQKLESGIIDLVGPKENLVPYLGRLYSLVYPEIETLSPESWKSKLREAGKTILSALSRRAPTIFFLEDLHWADPSFVEFLRYTLLEVRESAVVLCVYRPNFRLFPSDQESSISIIYKEISIKDLTTAEAQDMLESLLKTKNIPSELRRFVQNKAEGNPFYLEELVNSLIETNTLARDNGRWLLTKKITDSDIPSTIHGVVSGRIDRLETATKRILQEASVIGRTFLCDILKQITTQKGQIETGLSSLERLDLIRTGSLQPDLEYMFKHALTQEVVYSSLLKKERQEIHERIGVVIEELFHDRLNEFSEILAFHFRKGKSIYKAIDYLMQSGKKSLKRYAVEESHLYYKEAYDILTSKTARTEKDERLLIELLNAWAPVYYFRGAFKELEKLLTEQVALVESLENGEERGMFYVWLGMSLYGRERFKDAYRYLCDALRLGEQIGCMRVISYACAWLPWVCVELGFLKEATAYGERARQLSDYVESDHYPYFQSFDSDGYAFWVSGESLRTRESGKALLDYGKKHSSIRCLTWGYYVEGLGYLAAGDFSAAIRSNEKALESSEDPFYTQLPKLFLGMSYLSNRQYDKAREYLQEVLKFSQNVGCELLGTPSQTFLGVVSIAEGDFSHGMEMLQDARRWWLEAYAYWRYTFLELILGEVFLGFVRKEAPISFSSIIRNLHFLIKTIPFAGRKAEHHYNQAISASKEIGAKGIQAQASFGLGRLYITRGEKCKAAEWLSSAIVLFEDCKADSFLARTKEALSSLK